MKEQSGHLSRQKNFLQYFVIFLILSSKTFADGNPFPVGARAWGLANATIAHADYYSIGNNVAGLGGIKTAAIFSTYSSVYHFDGINTLGVGAVMPVTEELGIGLSIQRFGDKIYNQISIGAGAGHKIGRFSLGLKINYLQTAINASAITFSKKAVVVEFGGIVMLSSKFYLGASMFNLTQATYSDVLHEKVNTVLRAGFLYKPSEKVGLSAEMEKVSSDPLSLKIGLEYEVVKRFFLRTGINTTPQTNHFGIGFKGKQFNLDFATQTHPHLGWSHHFSLCYHFVDHTDN